MNILSIDTSTAILSIALKTDNSYEERLIDGNFSHSENLLFEIEALLKRAGLTIQALDFLVCTRGPGSFTGLRVGMATLKGFASALDIPLVSIPTLQAISESASIYSGPILSVLDAKKKRFYYRITKDNTILVDDRDGNPEDILSFLDGERILITGPDAKLFYDKVLAIKPDANVILDPYAPRNISSALIKLGLETLEKIGPDDIGQGPVYIRRSDAEESLLKRIEEAQK